MLAALSSHFSVQECLTYKDGVMRSCAVLFGHGRVSGPREKETKEAVVKQAGWSVSAAPTRSNGKYNSPRALTPPKDCSSLSGPFSSWNDQHERTSPTSLLLHSVVEKKKRKNEYATLMLTCEKRMWMLRLCSDLKGIFFCGLKGFMGTSALNWKLQV